MAEDRWGISTRAVHSGRISDRRYGFVYTPVFMEDAFFNPNPGEGVLRDPLTSEEYMYSRNGNPTITAVEKQIASLEEGEACLTFSSGMGAIAASLLTFLKPGDHVVAIRELYGQTYSFFKFQLPKLGVEVSYVNVAKLEHLPDYLRPNTKVLYLESITNPVLRVPDISAAARVAREGGVLTVVDATFANPCNQKPLKLGADVVVHSATKSLNGHGDLIAGAAVSTLDKIKKIRDYRTKLGASLGVFDAFLLSRGIKTLTLRTKASNANAHALAEALGSNPSVSRVYYPGLDSHPDYSVAKKVLTGYGGMVSFEVRGGLDAARRVVGRLKLGSAAPSLGSVQTLVTVPCDTSHHPRTGITPEELREMGIGEGLIRVSAGIEDTEDLVEDFAQALS